MSSFLNQPNFDARGRLFGLSSFSEEIPFSIPDTTAKIDWFHLSCPGLQFVDVVHIEGTEALSQPYVFRIWVRLYKKDKDQVSLPSDLIGKKVSVEFKKDKTPQRFFHGLISHVRPFSVPKIRGHWFLCLEIRPQWWFLKMTKDSCTYQEQPASDILKDVLKKNKIDLKDQMGPLGKKKRIFCVQYQESTFDFLSRLMEEEGIGYTFIHEKSKHVMLLFDEKTGLTQKNPLAYRDEEPKEKEVEAERLLFFERRYAPVVGSVATTDFAQGKPAEKLYAKQPGQIKQPFQSDVYQHPGYISDLSMSEKTTKRWIESEEWPALLFEGRSSYGCLSDGEKIKTQNCRDKSLDAAYHVLEVIHRHGFQKESEHFDSRTHFLALPDKTPFRPERVRPRPHIIGVMTAIVVGKKNDEICTDSEYPGRIKIRFYWDRGKDNLDEKSSCWVRVAVPFADKGFGFFGIPRVGQEVLVQFEEGDPERPVVIGCLYNGDNRPPHLKEDKTKTGFQSRSTPKGTKENFNEICLTDQKDKEEFYLQAEKDMVTLVKNERKTTIQKSHDTTVLQEGNFFCTIQKGCETRAVGMEKPPKEAAEQSRLTAIEKDDVLVIGQNMDTDVGKDLILKVKENGTSEFGKNIKITVKKDGTVQIDGALEVKVKKDTKISVDGSLKFSVKKDVVFDTNGAFKIDAKKNFQVKAMGVDIKAKTSAKINGGASLEAKASASAKIDAAMVTIGKMVNLG